MKQELPARLARENGFDRHALAAYKAAVRRYGKKPWVTGIGIGIKEQRGKLHASLGPVIVIYVTKKLKRVPKSRQIPPFILGVPTDVLTANFEIAMPDDDAEPKPQPPSFPLQPGASIAPTKGSASTLGAIVRTAAGARQILTSAHVLLEGDAKDVMHPGPLDIENQLVKVAKVTFTHQGVDAGIAALENGIAANNTALRSNITILEPAVAIAGDIVEKSGRTTDVTQGLVRAVGGFVGGVGPVAFIKPLLGDTKPIARKGDSGSVWYDADSDHAKALHHGQDKTTHEAVAILLVNVMSTLKVTWD